MRRSKLTVKPSVPAVIDRFRNYHDIWPVWGALHIVLGDLNVEDCHVDFCIEWALNKGDQEGVALGRLLRIMSRTQRLKLAEQA